MEQLSQPGRKRYHFVYRTTNLVNGKFYIGVHSTWDLSDGYLGSGKYIRMAIRKYGRENFTCEILQFFDDRDSAYLAEKEEVAKHFGTKPCMNLHPGGCGGWANANERRAWLHRNNPKWAAENSETMRGVMRKRVTDNPEEFARFLDAGRRSSVGRPVSEEKRAKHSAAMRGRHTGSDNSQHGWRWIHDSETLEARKVPPTTETPAGWSEGRRPKTQKELVGPSRTWMNLNGKSRIVKNSDVDAFAAQGWTRGRI